MPVFHLFTVTPIDVAENELPAVQYGDYYIQAPSLAGALANVRAHGNVLGAAEVWGAPLGASFDGVIVDPYKSLNRREKLSQHRHWSMVQDRYKLLQRGAESPEQFVERRFAERHPEFASTPEDLAVLRASRSAAPAGDRARERLGMSA